MAPPLGYPVPDRAVGRGARHNAHACEVRADDGVTPIRLAQLRGAGSGQLLMRRGAQTSGCRVGPPDDQKGPGYVRIPKETHTLRLGQRSGLQVHVNPVAGDQRVDVVVARLTQLRD